jgi:hypothetical protein
VAINKSSVIGFILRELGYAQATVVAIVELISKDGPLAEAVVSAIVTAMNQDLAAFSGGKAVVGPPIPCKVDGTQYNLTLHFDPAPVVPQTIVTTPAGAQVSIAASVVSAAPVVATKPVIDQSVAGSQKPA